MSRSVAHYLVAQLGWMFCLFILFHEANASDSRTPLWRWISRELPNGRGNEEMWLCVIWLTGALTIAFLSSLLSSGKQSGTQQTKDADNVRVAAKRRL